MLSRVLLNALTKINAYHYARAHAYTHIYTFTNAALWLHSYPCNVCIITAVYSLQMRHIFH